MEQFLYQAEWTGPAADKTSENTSQNAYGAYNIQSEKILSVFQGYTDAGHQLLE